MASEVRFESNAKEVQRAIRQLEKKALREIAKVLRKQVKKATPKDEGVLRKNVGTWVKGKAKEDPVLQLGVYDRARARKKGYQYAYHAHLIQFGTVKMRATDYLRAPVFQNLDVIIAIQAEYLRQIEHIKANGLPNEEDEVADD
ncbi:HK97-gp10 family putative phage morphogenesis protein [Cytobacillus sp. FSL H8-0458]|uniref:HK97-gp10 family putative phage morphogenesis protein n=1 Tax=Cytobacillus sp. FSL H8-0458 TaxID=2975346 RepID=UPI0030FB2B35